MEGRAVVGNPGCRDAGDNRARGQAALDVPASSFAACFVDVIDFCENQPGYVSTTVHWLTSTEN